MVPFCCRCLPMVESLSFTLSVPIIFVLKLYLDFRIIIAWLKEQFVQISTKTLYYFCLNFICYVCTCMYLLNSVEDDFVLLCGYSGSGQNCSGRLWIMIKAHGLCKHQDSRRSTIIWIRHASFLSFFFLKLAITLDQAVVHHIDWFSHVRYQSYHITLCLCLCACSLFLFVSFYPIILFIPFFTSPFHFICLIAVAANKADWSNGRAASEHNIQQHCCSWGVYF